MRKFKWVLECFRCTDFEVCELSVADEIFGESCDVQRDDLFVHVVGVEYNCMKGPSRVVYYW